MLIPSIKQLDVNTRSWVLIFILFFMILNRLNCLTLFFTVASCWNNVAGFNNTCGFMEDVFCIQDSARSKSFGQNMILKEKFVFLKSSQPKLIFVPGALSCSTRWSMFQLVKITVQFTFMHFELPSFSCYSTYL